MRRVAALERYKAEAVAEVGEATGRAWHLTFSGSALNFEADRQEISHVLMSSAGQAAPPSCRAAAGTSLRTAPEDPATQRPGDPAG